MEVHPEEVDHGGVHIATWNVRGNFCSRLAIFLTFAQEQHIDILCLQEANINQWSLNSVCVQALKFGYQTFVARPVARGHGGGQSFHTVTFAAVPAIQVTLPTETDPTRYVALDVHRNNLPPVTVVNMYAHAQDPAARTIFIDITLRDLARLTRDYIVIGDFNTTCEDPAISKYLSTGVTANLDDDFSDLPTTTTAGTGGRIDFGLCNRILKPTARSQGRPAKSDHDYVSYAFEWKWRQETFLPPKRKPVRTVPVEAQAFRNAWLQHDLNLVWQRANPDEMWTKLSDVAELLLCGEAPALAFARSTCWKPTKATATHKKALEYQSVRWRRLLRMRRRVSELAAAPEHETLRKHVRLGLVGLTELEHLNHLDIEQHLDDIDEVISRKAAVERQEGLDRWWKTVGDDAQARSKWVMRGSREHAAQRHGCKTKTGATTAVSTPDKLKVAAVFWQALWTKPHPTDDAGWDLDMQMERIREHLHQVKRAGGSPKPLIEALHLIRRAETMKRKAGGADNWTAEHLLLLPLEWWEAFADVWNRSLECGIIPTAWASIRVVLIDKVGGGTRPLGIAALAWRLGASLIQTQLGPWIEDWAPNFLTGGLPGRGLLDSHASFAFAVETAMHIEGGITCVSEDLAKAFDSISPAQALAVLVYLGLHPQVAGIIVAFYCASRRIFTMDGAVASEWIVTTRSLLQGCPFSALLMAAIMLVWVTCFVLRIPRARVSTYLDDRIWWLAHAGASSELAADFVCEGLALGRELDLIFGLTANVDKGQAASSHSSVLEVLETRPGARTQETGATCAFADARSPAWLT